MVNNRPIFAWNNALVEQLREEQLGSPDAARVACLLNLSLYDIVNDIDMVRSDTSLHEQYVVDPTVTSSASRPLAANAAGHEILTDAFGSKQRFDQLFEEIEQSLADEAETEEGTQWGRTVATEIIERRSDDGHDAEHDYDACEDSAWAEECGENRIGFFRDTDWGSAHWADVDWWMFDAEREGADKFRPDGPPPHDSEAYAEGWRETYEKGDVRKMDESDEEWQIAAFWRAPSGAIPTAGRWIKIALTTVSADEYSISELSRLFAQLSLALGEASLATMEAKVYYGFWRPRRAIWHADEDGNDATTKDEGWDSMAFGGSPEYLSGLAALGGAGKTILAEYVGDETPFDLRLLAGTSSDDLEETTRSFDSFTDALEESLDARLYAGNHFPFTLTDSREAGETIAEFVLEESVQPIE